MKFYNITSNNFKQPLLFLFIAFFAIEFQAQNTSNSPYSRFGIGDLQTVQTPRNMGMGGLSVGLVGGLNLSTKNPASYMNLGTDTVVFDVSIQGTYSKLREKQPDSEIVSANTNNVSLGQISFAFPITSWLKSCFGLTPNSNMSYDVVQEVWGDPNIGGEKSSYHGQGGLNHVFLGVAIGTSRVSVGANANYHIGSFVRRSDFYFFDTAINSSSILVYPTQTRIDKQLEANGFSVDFGFQFRQPISSNYQLGVGFTYSPKYNLNATRALWAFSMVSDNDRDTIVHGNPPQKGTLQMPDMYTIGLSFEKLNRWVFGVEYSRTNFKNYQEFSKRDPDLSNAFTLRTGMELKGQQNDNDFLNRLSYRVGYHYGTNYVAFQNSEIKQFGFSFGIGMPIRRTQSKIDFAVEIGRKGDANAGQIQENYGRIVIGISAFDRWFMRGKFD
jgi:hypothetical protein